MVTVITIFLYHQKNHFIMHQKTYSLLKTLTNKTNIKLVSRGNKAILYALRIAKKLGKKKVFIQDQGNWITYKQFPKELNLDLQILKTDYGLINADELKNKVDKDSTLLINSLSGYFAEQDMNTIYNVCINKKCFLINDITGTVGTKAATIGDILACSFGNYKPINLGKGGLIATNQNWLNKIPIEEVELGEKLIEKINNLEKRLKLFQKTNKKIKHDLKNLEIIHKNKTGINVAVKYKDEKEKNEIIKYCEKNNFKYKLCKKVSDSTKNLFSFIKVNEDAVSIEVQCLR